MLSFAAIDFETADHGRDSACAVGVVRVEQGAIVGREYRLIRPPRSTFVFTHIHGITWDGVRNAPQFNVVWSSLVEILDGIAIFAAHNSAFDRSVLMACCATYGVTAPKVTWRCTVALARRMWNLRRARLPDVCRHLGFPLQHHDALSDAEACARIIMASEELVRDQAGSPNVMPGL